MGREIEFGTTGFYPPFDGVKRSVLAEEMGFDIQGFSENHSRAPDCFSEMRDAARATSRIKLQAGPVNFVTRHPGVVAAGIVPVHLLSEGRAICGVASGDSAAAAAGRKPQTIVALRRDVGYLRTLLDNGVVTYPDGRTSRLEWAEEMTWPRLPIQMAASGPRAIALAARTADRICLGIGTNTERVAWALDVVEANLAAAGRTRQDVRVGVYAPLAVTEDRARGRATIRTRVSAFAHMQSGGNLAEQPEILRRVTSVLKTDYDYRFHKPGAPADNPNSAVCDEEFGDWMGIGGPPSFIVERLGQLVELGVDFFMTALPLPEREPFAAEVVPAVRRLRTGHSSA
jgi:5,10-methylenetetrahydromethanopterin reductase